MCRNMPAHQLVTVSGWCVADVTAETEGEHIGPFWMYRIEAARKHPQRPVWMSFANEPQEPLSEAEHEQVHIRLRIQITGISECLLQSLGLSLQQCRCPQAELVAGSDVVGYRTY
jgi:hypothetical protein